MPTSVPTNRPSTSKITKLLKQRLLINSSPSENEKHLLLSPTNINGKMSSPIKSTNSSECEFAAARGRGRGSTAITFAKYGLDLNARTAQKEIQPVGTNEERIEQNDNDSWEDADDVKPSAEAKITKELVNAVREIEIEEIEIKGISPFQLMRKINASKKKKPPADLWANLKSLTGTHKISVPPPEALRSYTQIKSKYSIFLNIPLSGKWSLTSILQEIKELRTYKSLLVS